MTVPPSDGLALVVKVKIWVKLAVTVVSPSMVTSQAPLPEHAPDQLEKMYPLDVIGVTVTWLPEA